ncbi:bifunctional lysylphosphatidylglycerol flippase/synthetase MprF [Arthrobacter sp. A5]|uniref:bifunctional lysylphosphatidylglycerol flippase/synthetase MprF n=1 Tax=Arthrobacter sp. A5 TaxID=576926 RepID=UPI003DA8F42C
MDLLTKLSLVTGAVAAQRRARWSERLRWPLRRTPFTVAVLVIFWGLAALTGSLLAGPGSGQLNEISGQLQHYRDGHWWTLFTAIFFATNPAAYIVSTVLIAGAVGLLERRAGSLPAALTFFGGNVAAVLVFSGVTQLARYAGDGWLGQMADAAQLGPYPAVAACALAAAARLGPLWRRRLRVGVFAVALMLVLYVGHAEAVLALAGALAGLAIGRWTTTDTAEVRFHRSSAREIRNMLSIVVAVFAAGPLLAAVAKSPSGPLTIVRDIVLNPVPTVNELQASCGSTIDASCLQLAQTAGGLGGTLTLGLAVVPALLLLVCAEGLRRGHRLAVWIVVGVQTLVAALSFTYLWLISRVPLYVPHSHTTMLGSGFAHFLPVALTPLLIAVVLFLYRRRFTVFTSRRVWQRLLALIVVTGLVLTGSYSAAWISNGGLQRPPGGLRPLLAELARQYLPLPLPEQLGGTFARRDALESLLFHLCGPLFWTVVLLGVLTAFLLQGRRRLREEGALDRARRLIRTGGDSLSWMALWRNNEYWFTADGKAGLAYQEHGTVALTVAGPFGEPAAQVGAVEGFLDYCAERALTPCFYSVTGTLWPQLRAAGFNRAPVAQETRLRIGELEFKGKEWQNVRTALNKARKLGISVRWSSYRELPGHLRQQLSEVSEEWAARKPVPEMGFTLGGLEELKDDDVLCALAVDGDGSVHGVTSWLPVFADGAVVSWTLDFMRRRSDGFSGVMEFLIASAVLKLRDSVEVISLSGSPLAPERGETRDGGGGGAAGSGDDGSGDAGAGDAGAGDAGSGDARSGGADLPLQDAALARLLNIVGKALEPVYGFRSLAHFKSRFQPEYRTLYMMYPDPLTLPAVGRALSSAYLPDLSVRQTARLLRTLVS